MRGLALGFPLCFAFPSIKAQLETLTQRKVLLDAKVDPTILGGVVASVGSRTYDGSLKSQLREMGRQLLES